MNSWLPIAAGYAIILAAVLLTRFAPNSRTGRELRTWYGVLPTGERGERTRRDQFLSAGVAAAIGLGLLFSAFGIFAIGDRYPNGSRANLAAMTYMFGSFVVSMMAFVIAAIAVWKAMFWRIELPDWPEHRLAFADAMDRVIDGESTPEQEAATLKVRYQQPVIEQLRRNWLAQLKKHAGQLPEHYRSQFKEVTANIRASAG